MKKIFLTMVMVACVLFTACGFSEPSKSRLVTLGRYTEYEYIFIEQTTTDEELAKYPEQLREGYSLIGYDSFETYIGLIRRTNDWEAINIEKQRIGEAIIDEIIRDSTFELSEQELETEFLEIWEDQRDRAEERGMTHEEYYDKYLSENWQCMSLAEYEQELRENVKRQIQYDLVCDELIRIMDVHLTEEECKTIAKERFHWSGEAIEEWADTLEDSVLTFLMYDFLLENSVRVNP